MQENSKANNNEFLELNANHLCIRDAMKPSRFHVKRVSNDLDDLPQFGYRRRSSATAGSSSKRTSLEDIYDTRNLRSFRYYTREALPCVDHYRNVASLNGHISRPTLDELHGCDGGSRDFNSTKNSQFNDKSRTELIKFGWITGVLIRCLSGIWGIMLFLRMGWVVAHAGIGLGIMVILLSSVVTTLTSLSMSAICTNGEVKGGGTYYMISRSLGPEFGGSIGIIFSIANAVAVAMYTVGFAETVNSILKANNAQMAATDLDNMRIIGCITLFILLIIILIGTEWEAKVQIILIIVLITSMLNFVVGSFRSPDESEIEKGFVGWSTENIVENFSPAFRDGQTFFSIFSVYFPAATGILAGANISGDLKDPQKSIPLGTLSAIAVTTVSYIAFALIFGGTTVREVVYNGTALTIDGQKQGMYYNYNLMEVVALYGPIIYSGVFAASLSSALGSLVSAPKVFQALCADKLFPYIHFFAKGSGKSGEPIRGYFLAFAIALTCCLIADLNIIAPIISNFFLAAYCLINFSCFHASFSKTLGFRPSFKYYNMWVSFVGALLCLVVMFIMNWQTALITFTIEFILYTLVLFRKPDVNWGSSTQAQTYQTAFKSAYKLTLMPEHAKTYRPQVLLLCGSAFSRPALVDFAYQIVKGIGMMICGEIVQEQLSQQTRDYMIKRNQEWLQGRGIKSFYTLIDEESFASGAKCLIQATGVGKLKPNILFLGYKCDWQTCPSTSLLEYFNVIHEAFDKHAAVCILRVQNGLDYSRFERLSQVFETSEERNNNAFLNTTFVDIESNKSSSTDKQQRKESSLSSQCINSSSIIPPIIIESANDPESETEYRPEVPRNILRNIDIFRRKQPESTIDVWWLYDDGGLTMLIPYIIAARKQWSHCRLRVFALADKRDDLNMEQRNMAALLNKFRIAYSDVIIIPGISKHPKESSRSAFNQLIDKWRVKDGLGDSKLNESNNTIDLRISDTEFYSQKNKSYRQIRLREILEEHSLRASLIVMTLPMPRKGSCSASLFMAWLETLTHNMPPFLLIRGSHQSVLTFYS